MPVSRAVLDDDRSVSTAVVEAVAEAKGVAPMELQQPLHWSVDVDALDDLFRADRNSAAENSRISFTYAGYEITVRDGETVVVREFDDAETEQFE